MNAVAWLYLIFVVALLNLLVGSASLNAYLAQNPAITCNYDLQKFAALARRNMFQALLQLGLLVTGMLWGIYVLVSGQAGLLLILALNGAVLVAGSLGKKLEEHARSLPVSDPLLEERYKAICTTWVKKAFPDF